MADSKGSNLQSAQHVEKVFARVGLVAAGIVLLILVIVIDVLLTDGAQVVGEPEGDALDILTEDGRQLGRAESGVHFVLTPETLYEHQPNQLADEGYWINAWGLRGPTVETPKSRPRLLVVGGSAAFGNRGGSNASTLPKSLARSLPDFEILNGAVIGYLTSQEVALVSSKLIALEPDWIVAFDGWNDLYDRYWWENFGSFESSHRGVSVTFNAIENRLANYRRAQMEPSYALIEWWSSIVRNSTILRALYGGLASPPEVTSPTPLDPEMINRAIEGYVANMQRLDELARARNSRLLVVVQPALGQLLSAKELERARQQALDFGGGDGYWLHFPAAYRQFRERVTAALRQRGIAVLDASQALARRGVEGKTLFVDPVHLSPLGNDQVASLIVQEIKKSTTAPAPPVPGENAQP